MAFEVKELSEMGNRSDYPRMDSQSFLRISAVAFGIGFSIHASDHVRRGLASSPSRVLVIGTLQGLLAVLAIWMVARGSDRAPTAAILVGFGSAVLFTSGHLLPISPDSYVTGTDPSVTWFSWATAFGEITTGIVFGIAGLRARFLSSTKSRVRSAA